jgi:hypothetical protein
MQTIVERALDQTVTDMASSHRKSSASCPGPKNGLLSEGKVAMSEFSQVDIVVNHCNSQNGDSDDNKLNSEERQYGRRLPKDGTPGIGACQPTIS